MAAAVAGPVAMTSATGILALLEEDENQLRVAGLQRLNEVVDQFWHEIADYLQDIESLYEDPGFPGRSLAALVASKVLYHLEDFEHALQLALGAGSLFDLNTRSEYVDKIVAVAIDEYVKQRRDNFDCELKNQDITPIDGRLEGVVNRMFAKCLEDKTYKQGLGMALECRRLDKIVEFITSGDNVADMLEYCQNSVMTIITSKAFREKVLRELLQVYNSSSNVNFAALCHCHCVLNQPKEVAVILKDLLRKPDEASHMMAYQIGFDMVDNENQAFCNTLLSSPLLRVKEPPAPAPAAEAASGEAAPDAEGGAAAAPPAAPVADVAMAEAPGDEMTPEAKENLNQLRTILSGRTSIDLHLEFLYRNNRSDLLQLEIIKNSIDSKNSITHNGTVMAHSLMQCGTTSDVFLRKNLEWLAKATNWAKFSATASLGVIHKGHIKESRKILETYLPAAGGGTRGSPYSEGGALYAMGIIHANHYDPETKSFLLEQLHNAQASEVLQHGACLGLGLVCMATADEQLFEELKQTLYSDTAVAGEAAAYAIGLVMVGSAHETAIQELRTYAHDTSHEKIIRACALGLAMIMFRREEEAEPLIGEMMMDKDAILRYGGCFTIALAYVGTSNNQAIRKLLHVSVSDVSDDVRRAAVIALGFVMCNSPEQLPSVVKLLSESYNPHVRYAAAMAIGIACAGSSQLDAHNVLQPLMSDSCDFVRQGAIIAMGLLYMQTSQGRTERVKEFREKLRKVVADKHEDVMTRFGAILAFGIMDAGGRNCAASMFSISGMLRRGAAIGFCLFMQMWYWFPLIHMVSLTLAPTALIGLNKSLKIPKNFSVKSAARPSLFAYPEPLQPPKKEEQTIGKTAVLSTAVKAKAEKEKKDQENELKKAVSGTVADMDVDDRASVSGSVAGGGAASVAATQGTTVVDSVSDLGDAMDVESAAVGVDAGKETTTSCKEAESSAPAKAVGETTDKKDGDEKEEKKQPEPTEEVLQNPCRVLPAQRQHISYPKEVEGQSMRYTPLIEQRKVGFLLLTDARPDEPEELIEVGKSGADDEKEPDPPEPFEWTEADL
jgi:26S proteasome regulatory subunit N2